MEQKRTNAVKWICVTILVMFFVTWATIIIFPIGIFATISHFASDFLKSPQNIERKAASIPSLISNPKFENQSKSVKPKKRIKEPDRYLYLVYLRNGGTIKASSFKKKGDIYLLKNDSGLSLKIARSDIQNVKKMKL